MSVTTVFTAIRNVLLGKRGAAMVEYALLAGLIAVVAIASLQTLGSKLSTQFGSIASSL